MDKYEMVKEYVQRSTIKGIVFDFDGTLCSLQLNWNVLKAALSREMQTSFGKSVQFEPLSEVLHEIRTKRIHEYSTLLKIIERFEVEGMFRGYHHTELIEIIRDTNKIIAIYSMNTRKAINTFLEQHHLQSHINLVISQENCIEPKPTKKDLLWIAKNWEIDTHSIIFIGNSSHDTMSGEQAAIETIVL